MTSTHSGPANPPRSAHRLGEHGVDPAGVDETGVDERAAATQDSGQPGVDGPGVDKPGVDKHSVDKPGAGKPTAGKPSADEPGAEKSGADEYSVIRRGENSRGRRVSRLVVLSGPSGVGKSTVVAHLRRTRPEVWHSVSVTTRHPRPGEIGGLHYIFTDQPGFDRMLDKGELLEWAHFAGNRYGTPRQPVLDRLAAGTPTLLEIDPQGARQVRSAMPEALQVFLAPPSWDELVRRLTGRGTESPEVVERRLAAARVELACESDFDLTLVNTSIEQVADELLSLMGLS